uniref:Uncharacterized protein n=1 Tax=Romanomermis culicivorax TaxID=13658 RepID=A0A915JHY6_ROMCU
MPSRDYKSAGLFVPKNDGENALSTGRYRVSNGMYRVHRILSPDEIITGKQTAWLELEIRGLRSSELGLMQEKRKSKESETIDEN